ncbi:MAG: class IV adenylate cyclase [Terriglobales bacterium]
MAAKQEIEVKFRVDELKKLIQALRRSGFRLVTKSTHEVNTLYDLPGLPLRKRGDLLRLRKYGSEWMLTHKAKGKTGPHKIRVETETRVTDGPKIDAILRALGFSATFRYEKFRAEWSDGKGHVVVDETPIGNFGEIEGTSRWIDETAKRLQIRPKDYITDTYAALFFQWKKETASPAAEMTFRAVRHRRSSR